MRHAARQPLGQAAARPGWSARLRAAVPHGGSLPDDEWRQRHRVIVGLLCGTLVVVPTYAAAARGSHAVGYSVEFASMIAFLGLAAWPGASRQWRAISASMGLLTAVATLVDISGGLIEMHFGFFVVVVLLTLYEDWVPFLLAVAFVLIHHGVMGTIDPRAVFGDSDEWKDPWAWAALHAFFIALAGVAGVTAWGFNERVRQRMRATQAELERLGLTDALTGLRNRRSLMTDLDAAVADGEDTLLAIFDLNGFKEYNDRFGHPAGDSLLIRLTSALSATLSDDTEAYRLGGDEFCVLSRARGRDMAAVVEQWMACFSEHGEGFAISASSGLVRLPEETADASEALRLCDRRMYAAKHGRRTTAARQTRDVLLAALAARHTELGEHLTGVATSSEAVGHELGLAEPAVQALAYAAELHDVGKVAIPDSILSKPGPLDEVEWEFMRRHTVVGERILAVAPALTEVATIVRATHERYDGTGYPDGIVGDSIPLAARIIAVCDAYDAMTTERTYRRVVTHRQALAELQRCAGSQFDPAAVDAFVALYADTPPADTPPADTTPAAAGLALTPAS